MNTLKLLKIVKIMLDMPNGIIFRAGKGQAFPDCEPDRVTAEALKRRNNGFSLRDLTLDRKSIGSLSLIKIFKETPDYVRDFCILLWTHASIGYLNNL